MRNRPLLALALLLTGCSPSSQPPKAERPAGETPKAPVQAPGVYRVKFETTQGDFTVEVTRAWAPRGAARFYELVEGKFFDDSRFFRVVRNFIVQFGVSSDPRTNQLWSQLKLVDDPVKQSNRRGFLAFAQLGRNSRTTQVFINLADNSKLLDKSGFAPFARVVEGLDVTGRLYSGYGDMPPRGEGPDISKYELLGNQYLERSFPKLDAIRTARVLK